MTWQEYAIVGVVVVLLFGGGIFFRGKSAGASFAEQIAKAEGTQRPASKLAQATLASGRTADLVCTAQHGHHSLWIEYSVQGGRSGEWTEDVTVEITSPRPRPPERFTIGYDGEDHTTRPGLTGLLFFLTRVARDSPENMKLANLTDVHPGERIALRVTVHGNAAMRFIQAYVGVAPGAPTG
jgi:hypothetical protein